jgi:hypothetical protein
MTVSKLAELLIKEFGPLGGSSNQIEKFLHTRHGSLPKHLSRIKKPGNKRVHYDPYAVAEYVLQDRITGGDWIEDK